MNALSILKQDHQNVNALFERFERAAPDAHAEKKQIAEKIIEHLSVHAGIEELVFYPAIRARLAELQPTVLEALEEHHVAKMALAEIEKLPAKAERFDAKVKVLIESVRHHVEEEEDELFQAVREAFSVQELEEMGEALEKARATAPQRGHPFQPDQPPFNVILGVPVAIIDRVINTGKQAVSKVVNRR